MKRMLGIASVFCLALGAAKKPDAVNLITAPPSVSMPTVRTIYMDDGDVETIQARSRHNTMFVFEEGENVAFAGGGDLDKARWEMRSADDKRRTNVFYVKPLRAGSEMETDLNIITTGKHSYSFRLVSCDKCAPDVKVFVIHKTPKVEVPVVDPHLAQIESLTGKLEESKSSEQAAIEETKRTKEEAEAKIAKEITEFRKAYPVSLNCDYAYTPHNKAPFLLESVCSDDTHTYIKVGGELSSIYTYVDGKPALAQFEYERGSELNQGTYVISGVLSAGYLQLGKKSKLRFERIAK